MRKQIFAAIEILGISALLCSGTYALGERLAPSIEDYVFRSGAVHYVVRDNVLYMAGSGLAVDDDTLQDVVYDVFKYEIVSIPAITSQGQFTGEEYSPEEMDLYKGMGYCKASQYALKNSCDK